MIILLRFRYPRLAAVLGALSGVVTLILAIACHASAEVFILGAGSSLAVALARHQGRKRIAAGAEPSGLIGRLRR